MHSNAAEDMPKGWIVKSGVHRVGTTSVARPGSFPPCAQDAVTVAPGQTVKPDPTDTARPAGPLLAGAMLPRAADPRRARAAVGTP